VLEKIGIVYFAAKHKKYPTPESKIDAFFKFINILDPDKYR